jgi:hypothetical protein
MSISPFNIGAFFEAFCLTVSYPVVSLRGES